MGRGWPLGRSCRVLPRAWLLGRHVRRRLHDDRVLRRGRQPHRRRRAQRRSDALPFRWRGADPGGDRCPGEQHRLGIRRVRGNVGRVTPQGHLLPPMALEPNPPDPLSYELPDSPACVGMRRAGLRAALAGADRNDRSARPRRTRAGRPPDKRTRWTASSRRSIPRDGRGAGSGTPRATSFDTRTGTGRFTGIPTARGTCSTRRSTRRTPSPRTSTPFAPRSRGSSTPTARKANTSAMPGTVMRRIRRHGAVKERYGYDLADNLVEKTDGVGRVLQRFEILPGNLDGTRALFGPIPNRTRRMAIWSLRPRRRSSTITRGA